MRLGMCLRPEPSTSATNAHAQLPVCSYCWKLSMFCKDTLQTLVLALDYHMTVLSAFCCGCKGVIHKTLGRLHLSFLQMLLVSFHASGSDKSEFRYCLEWVRQGLAGGRLIGTSWRLRQQLTFREFLDPMHNTMFMFR